MPNVIEAPAAPAADTAPAVPTAAESRSGGVTEPSRPAGPDNITGAELSARIASTRRARRSAGVADQPKPTGAPAKQASASQTAASTTGASGGADPDSEHATSPPAGEAAVIDSLVNGGEEQGGEPQNAESQATQTATDQDPAAAEQSLEDLLDDPESASEDQIKAVKDRGIRKLLSRVHKLTARLKEAERGKPSATPEAAPETSTAGDPRVVLLEQNLGLIREAAQWARQNPDGGEFKNSQGKVIGTYTPEQVEGILANAPNQIATLAAKLEVRQEALQQERHQVTRAAMEEARKAYPWMAKPDSEEYSDVLGIVEQAPWIKQQPDWPVWIADAIAGRRARMSQGAAAGKAKPQPRPIPPKVPPPSSAAAPRVDPAAKQLAEAEAAYSKSGKQSDFQVVMRLRRQAKTR